MDYNLLSPYVRYAIHHTLVFPFEVCRRIIFDYEIIFMQDGMCRLEYEDKIYICEKGDVIFLRPGHVHRITGINNTNMVQPHVHFDMIADSLSEKRYICFETFDNIPSEDRVLLSCDMADINVPTVFKPQNPDYLKAQLFELIELFSEKGDFYQLLCKEKMLHILYVIFSQFDKGQKNDERKVDMMNIKSYIDGNFSQRITLDFLSERFLINKFYIEVNFKKYFGISPIKYYNNVRYEKACELLKQGKRVGETADKIGFENIYSFSRFFKNISGVSPSEY